MRAVVITLTSGLLFSTVRELREVRRRKISRARAINLCGTSFLRSLEISMILRRKSELNAGELRDVLTAIYFRRGNASARKPALTEGLFASGMDHLIDANPTVIDCDVRNVER